MLALVTVSALFLRWLPQYGIPILLLFAIATAAAAAIYFTQRRRYSTSSHGIRQESVEADIPAIFWTALTGVVLAGLGITVVIFAT